MKNLIKLSFAIYIIGTFFIPSSTLAASFICSGTCANTTCVSYTSALEAGNKCVPPDGQPANVCVAVAGTCSEEKAPTTTSSKPPTKDNNITKLDNPLVGVYSVTDILGNVIKVALSLMGGLVLVMVVKGATGWITANGNAEQIEAGTKTIVWAIIGAILTAGSYVILQGIMNAYFHPLSQ